ncbi:50S ribosomal protein L21 [Planctomycetota bacterium]
MYAVIEQGGKQYKITEGDQIDIELAKVAPDATTLELDKVLLISDGEDVKIGTPYLEGAKIIANFASTAEQAIVKGIKLYPTQFRRRKNSQRRIGHRQKHMRVTVSKIEG